MGWIAVANDLTLRPWNAAIETTNGRRKTILSKCSKRNNSGNGVVKHTIVYMVCKQKQF